MMDSLHKQIAEWFSLNQATMWDSVLDQLSLKDLITIFMELDNVKESSTNLVNPTCRTEKLITKIRMLDKKGRYRLY